MDSKNSHILKFASFNLNGLTSSRPYLYELLNQNHIVCVSEHWQTDLCAASRLLDIHCDFDVLAVADDDRKPENVGKCRGRGKGGVGIFWRKSLSDHINVVKGFNSDKICAIEINGDIKLFVICVYLPDSSSPLSFSKTLDYLETIITDMMESGQVMIMGDFNAHLGGRNGFPLVSNMSSQGVKLYNMINRTGLVVADLKTEAKGPEYTFHRNNARSYIDHIVTVRLMNRCLVYCVYRRSIHVYRPIGQDAGVRLIYRYKPMLFPSISVIPRVQCVV